jgi:peptidoglycan/xylan/chitin deacetylase (PgdA/CDA1 family)
MVSRLDERTLEDEVGTNHRLIEERTGCRVLAFAYPNGEAADFDDRAVALLKRLGLLCAVTCRHALAGPDHDPFRLPRLSTRGPSLALFAARLAGLGRREATAQEVS